ncbi:MAG TPA: hypothetical protein VGS13_11095 [Stellaceae bacterium]|nr:hypothetical protein [Stellaceae bacterium]
MATQVGGRFKFSPKVHLGLKVGTAVKPGPIAGDLNIEVVRGATSPGTLAAGFAAGVTAADTTSGAGVGLSGFGTGQTLFAQRVTLFGGNYKVVDTNTSTVAGNRAVIIAGSGHQTVVGAARDTLIGGSGIASLTGATGDRIGVGVLTGPTHTVGGTLSMSHKSTIAGAIAFGTNNGSVSGAVKYGTGTASRTTVPGSAAHVTVTNFRAGTDTLFYKGETTAVDNKIVAAAISLTIFGKASSKIFLPDGTAMTLIGVSTTQLKTENGAHLLFK